MGGPQSIVLLTIDCWRYDVVRQMNSLRAATEDFVQTEAIYQSAAISGIFPSIFVSQYYPKVHTPSGHVPSDTILFPEVLSDNGYQTEAIIADNLFLNHFAAGFDTFWNSDERQEFRFKRLTRVLLQRDSVPVNEISRRAENWLAVHDGPHFLFLHLMDPHEPYLVGLRRGLKVGPLASYYVLWQFARDRQRLSAASHATIENLYRQCIDYVDAHITELLSAFPSDACGFVRKVASVEKLERLANSACVSAALSTGCRFCVKSQLEKDFFNKADACIIIMGDHGEEFNHGAYRHARLYDECVRVPFFARNMSALDEDAPPVRQIDLAPTLLNGVNIDIPDEWDRHTFGRKPRVSFMLNHSPHLGAAYVGYRTSNRKLIKTSDETGRTERRTEYYNLAADPNEQYNLCGSGSETPSDTELTENLSEFLGCAEIKHGIFCGIEPNALETDISTEARLEMNALVTILLLSEPRWFFRHMRSLSRSRETEPRVSGPVFIGLWILSAMTKSVKLASIAPGVTNRALRLPIQGCRSEVHLVNARVTGEERTPTTSSAEKLFIYDGGGDGLYSMRTDPGRIGGFQVASLRNVVQLLLETGPDIESSGSLPASGHDSFEPVNASAAIGVRNRTPFE